MERIVIKYAIYIGKIIRREKKKEDFVGKKRKKKKKKNVHRLLLTKDSFVYKFFASDL